MWIPGQLKLNRLTKIVTCKRSSGESYHVIRGTADVTSSRHKVIFTFISPALKKLEKQDKFQPKDKSYLYNISESEAEPLKDDSAARVSIPKAAAFSLRYLNFVTADISRMSFDNLLELFLLTQICLDDVLPSVLVSSS